MQRILPGLLIALLSFIALAMSETTAAIQAMIALPGSAGLLHALWEVLKGDLEHQRRLEEDAAKNAFVLSATSHMAEKAFNKHVEFCEKYVAKTDECLWILFAEGPTEKALQLAGQLFRIRREFILWETKDVGLFLEKFEKALRDIGAKEHLLKHVPVGEKRTKLVETIEEVFRQVSIFEPLPDGKTPEIAIAHIIDCLRDHLGISQLTNLRKHYLAEAAKRIQ
jgi:hypothetical protein